MVNSCCMHVEALSLLVFVHWFFKSTKRNEGRWADMRRPDSHIPMSHGPLPTDRNQEEVFNPVHHEGRRHPNSRRNMFSGMGGSMSSEEARRREEEQAEATRQEQERADRRQQQEQEEARRRQQEQEEARRRQQEQEEARRRQQEQEDARRQEQEQEEARRQEQEDARRQEQQEAAARRAREAAEEASRQAEEEARRQQQEAAEAQERERREREAADQDHQGQENENQEQTQTFLEQSLHQRGTVTCYAASSCAFSARLGLHRRLQSQPTSPQAGRLHLSFSTALSSLTDSSLDRISAEEVVRSLNSSIGPDGNGEFRYSVMEVCCAGEFFRDLVGELHLNLG